MKTMSMTITTTGVRTFHELKKLKTFEERYEYLKLDGAVGRETFGFDRWLNQKFYTTAEWRKVRDIVLIRDGGRDLGVEGYDILGNVYIHHMNPITKEDILGRSEILLNPDYLICASKRTHDMIHYGNDGESVYSQLVERTPGDTCPWRRK